MTSQKITYVIEHKETTVSTNDDAVALARKDAPEGTVIVADVQTGGRGRLGGRVWESPRGNAYFSFIVRPQCEQDRVSTLSLVVALAVHEALAGMGVDSALKYPNDVFVADKKITGILLESGVSASGVYVAIGVGVDVFKTENSSDAFSYLADHVAHPEPTLIDETIAAVLGAFAREYGQWQQACALSPGQDARYRSFLINPGEYR